MHRHILFAAAAVFALPVLANASSVTVDVAGSANPFLAAQPSGAMCCGDSAPDQSPTLAAHGAQLTAGNVLTFSATGGVSYQGGATSNGADGDNDGVNYTYRFDMTPDSGTGVSGPIQVNVDGLVGVFVDGTPGSTAPAPLDFTGGGASTGLDFTSLTPGIDQIFWIGDGLTGLGTGAVQKFVIPTNATGFYLGTVDGSGWNNNSGNFSVTVDGLSGVASAAPEPAAWALMLIGLGAMGASLRRRRSVVRA